MTEAKCISGGCLCGAVRFEAHLPSKWCGHCHCKLCRKAHGAGYVTWVGFPSAQFRLLTDSDSLKWYESSKGARRGFCPACGSTMLFESERWPGETHIALGCINEKIDREPEANSSFDSHVDWMPIDGTLRQSSG